MTFDCIRFSVKTVCEEEKQGGNQAVQNGRQEGKGGAAEKKIDPYATRKQNGEGRERGMGKEKKKAREGPWFGSVGGKWYCVRWSSQRVESCGQSLYDRA